MKQRSTLFLKGVIYVVGIVVLGLCLFLLPMGIMSDQTGMYRPLLIGMYVPAIPFFFALYQALKLLSYIDKNTAFSNLSVEALKKIKHCGVAVGALYTAGMPYIIYVMDKDDAPGGVAMALVIIGASFVIAVFASLLQKLVQNAIDIKAENDLTV